MVALFQKHLRRNVFWFRLGIAGVFLLSFALRFWGLSRFNTLVFDEAHFAVYANNYLTHTRFFDNHPPLGKYLIAIGIWLSQLNPFGYGATNNLTGSTLSPFSYRWMSALTGSFIPLVVMGVAYQLSHRRSYVLLVGLFAALDGLFLVESRYALINVYLIFFGLLGQWLVLIALERSHPDPHAALHKQKWFLLMMAGVCFGASAAVKWNGLAFLLGTYLMWISAWWIQRLQRRWSKPSWATRASTEIDSSEVDSEIQNVVGDPNIALPETTLPEATLLTRFAQLRPIDMLYNFAVVPAIVYYLVWIPHLQLHSDAGFWTWQRYMIESHQAVGKLGMNANPYCSVWYTWLWMQRPVGYYFGKTVEAAPPQSSLLFPVSPPQQIYYDVHAIGNPALWWLSSIAIAFLLIGLIQKVAVINAKTTTKHNKILLIQTPNFWLPFYLIVNYLVNLLPWMQVNRCAFLYHYMGASIFALLALAWFINRWLHSRQIWLKAIGLFAIYLILTAFVYWMPIYLGLPLSPEEYDARMWFPSWR